MHLSTTPPVAHHFAFGTPDSITKPKEFACQGPVAIRANILIIAFQSRSGPVNEAKLHIINTLAVKWKTHLFFTGSYGFFTGSLRVKYGFQKVGFSLKSQKAGFSMGKYTGFHSKNLGFQSEPIFFFAIFTKIQNFFKTYNIL